jgi:hypothetical protein
VTVADFIPDADWIDIGNDCAIVFTSSDGHTHAGLIHSHTRPGDGKPCAGGILFDLPGATEAHPGRPLWHLVSIDPLTVTPSLLCSCGSHGFITDGKWVPC